MAIVEYTEHWQGTSSTSNQTDGTTTRVFDIICDGNDAPFEHLIVERSAIFPQKYEVHPFSNELFVVNRSVTPNPGPTKYLLTINYSSIGDPTQIPPAIEWTFATSTEPIDRDFEGEAITNSAGETSDPPLTEEFSDLVYRLSYNTWEYNTLLSAQYMGAVNSDLWFGVFEPETCKVITLSGQYNGSETVPYWTVTQEVQIRLYDTWVKRVLDQGFREKTGVDEDGKATYTTIKDSNGDPLSQPVLLDGNGSILKDGLDPVYLEFWTKPRLPFAGVILAL